MLESEYKSNWDDDDDVDSLDSKLLASSREVKQHLSNPFARELHFATQVLKRP
jgi:hypothetical protein